MGHVSRSAGRRKSAALAVALLMGACTGEIGPGAGGSGAVDPVTGAPVAGSNGRGGTTNPSGGGTPAPGGASPTPGGTTPTPGTAAPGMGAIMPVVSPTECASPVPPSRSPLRRLTRFEYNNTVRDLLGDATLPGNALPSEQAGSGFANDADAQSVSSLLAEQYAKVAEGIAQRATASAAALAKLAPCGSTVTAPTEEACARTTINALAPRAYRRPLATGEADELLGLYRAVRPAGTFASSVAAVIEMLLQSPDFLYRIEWGEPDPARPAVRRPTGREMASRLSYLFWGSMPDPALEQAADTKALGTADGVLKEASRLLDDPRSRPIVTFFFDNLLPISELAHLERDKAQFPAYNASVGALMRQETQRFMEHEIFEGPGSWTGALTASYTFLNEELAKFYGVAGVTGTMLRKTPINMAQRLGVLTQAGVMAGTTHSNHTNPVKRGAFIVSKMMCTKIPIPPSSLADQIKPPDPYAGKTARERYSQHSKDAACAGCHSLMDPVGLVLENYDPVGLFRTKENDVTIDTTGALPGVAGAVSGPIDLMQKLAAQEATGACFASKWATFAYGRVLTDEDKCTQASLVKAFMESNYNIKRLLLALTQTDAFLLLAPR